MNTPTEFDIFLRGFDEIISGNPVPEKVKKQLNELKDSAKQSNDLTDHQRGAILARCNNYLDGSWGKELSKAPVNKLSPVSKP